MKDEKRYTIGQMAELCHVSKRILRYYDQNGIVVPACRDKSTNYRYYTESQIEQILFLQELRELSLPVKTIGRLFPDRDLLTFEMELEQHLADLRAELTDLQMKYDRTLDVFLRVVRGRVAVEDIRRMPDAQIQRVRFHKRMVAFTRQSSLWDDSKRQLSGRGALLNILANYQFNPVGSHMTLFYDGSPYHFRNKAKMADLEFFIEVKNGSTCEPCRMLDAFDAISCVCAGPYENLAASYRQMEQFAQEQGISLTGTAIEEYLVDPTMTSDPNQYVTRLYMPIEP